MIDNDELVILVDDDEDEVLFFRYAMEKIGRLDTFKAMTDGTELVDYLSNPKNKLPAFVFLDINMPKMSGLEALRWIRQKYNPFLLHVAIYATAVDEQEIITAATLGANLFIRKPGEIKALSIIIEQTLSRNWEELKKSVYYCPLDRD